MDGTCDTDQATTPAELYRLHSADLRRLLLSLLRNQADAEDALQRVFVKVLENWQTIDYSTAKSWMFTVAYREAMTMRRQRGVDSKALTRIWETPVWQLTARNETPTEAAIRKEQNEAAQGLLNDLPATQRDVVIGRVFAGKTFATLAAEFNLPLGTVLTRMRLALKKLRTMIED